MLALVGMCFRQGRKILALETFLVLPELFSSLFSSRNGV